MKTSSCIIGLVGLGWLIYALFQPVFIQFFGWETLPERVHSQKFEGIRNNSLQEEITFSEHLIDSIQTISHSPSISISASIKGEIVWSYAIGFQNIIAEIPADTSTQYRIGSISKALTSLGFGKMIQDEIINPDSSIQYYTDLFNEKPKITIQQLASHQSGIRNYDVCFCFPIWEYYRNKEFGSIKESVEEFESDELLFYPGENFSYSSYNFTALSLAMDNVTPIGFLGYMETVVFDQLGMNKTIPEKKEANPINRAIPYEIDGNWFNQSSEVNLSNKWAGGGFLSTPSDLVRAGNTLLDSTWLNKKTIQMLTTPQRLNNDSVNNQNYALGWRHNNSSRYFNGNKKIDVIHHGGMAMGGQAILLVFTEYNLVLALAMNKGGTEGNFRLFDYIAPIANAFLKTIEENNS